MCKNLYILILKEHKDCRNYFFFLSWKSKVHRDTELQVYEDIELKEKIKVLKLENG